MAPYVRGFFGNDFLIQKLLDWTLRRPVALPYGGAAATPFVLHEGKVIGNIYLHKRPVFGVTEVRWQRLLNKVMPVTQDWVIHDQLHFAVGDRVVGQQLLRSEQRLAQLPFIGEAQIEVEECLQDDGAVDVRVTTQDQLPLAFTLDALEGELAVAYNNLLGWGHMLQNRFFFFQPGLGYGFTYRAPDIRRSGITGELAYLNRPRKKHYGGRVFSPFDDEDGYAGELALGYTDREKRFLLDGDSVARPTRWALYAWDGWLGRAFRPALGAGQVVVTGWLMQKHFAQRPVVAQGVNRCFHNYLLGGGGLGFVSKGVYEDEMVYGVGLTEYIPYGSKVNLMGGYELGQFVHRPYLRLDLAWGRAMAAAGHWYGAMNVGGFWHESRVEQGIVKLQLSYFTPLLGVGQQWIRQFVDLHYLAGFNMFTGEQISTNTARVSSSFADPFPRGTRRLRLCLETVVFTPWRWAGAPLAALGFVELVRLQDALDRVHQGGFCKALGLGLKVGSVHDSFGTLQLRVAYHPLVQQVGFGISNAEVGSFDDLEIGRPGLIPFRQY